MTVIQYKEIFSETYTTYSLYFKDIWYNCSTKKKVCLKHIPGITFTLNIYDIFALYTRWNIYTNQMKVQNYTSWNIKTKPMTLVTYISRCRKLHLKLLTFPTCSDGWNQGVRRSRGMLLLPIKWPRLTGAIGTGLQRRHIACGSRCHMKPIQDGMFIHKVNLQWNLPDQMFIHNVHWWWNLPDQIVIHKANLRWNLPHQIFIHKVNLQWNLPDHIFIHKVNLRWNLPDEMSIHKVNLWWNLPDQMSIHNAHWWWNLPDQIFIHKVIFVVKPTRSNFYT